MIGFTWSERCVSPASRQLPGDLWCVRDAFSALMHWEPGSQELSQFIEAPDGQADLERLIDHLGLFAYDPECPEHADPLRQAIDRPGIACHKLHRVRIEHCMFQPHVRHFLPLPPVYRHVAPQPELFQIIVDVRQDPHTECSKCR